DRAWLLRLGRSGGARKDGKCVFFHDRGGHALFRRQPSSDARRNPLRGRHPASPTRSMICANPTVRWPRISHTVPSIASPFTCQGGWSQISIFWRLARANNRDLTPSRRGFTWLTLTTPHRTSPRASRSAI